MPTEQNRLRRIYDRTSGLCHICRKQLSFVNYGRRDGRGCWEIEHSHPRAKGGTDHGNNLFAACCDCNRTKGIRHTRTARKVHGYRTAPLSREKAAAARGDNTIAGGSLGVLVGAVAAGPVGALLGGLLGAKIGNNSTPHRE